VAVALLGKMIYRREFGERGENAYAAGLVHDIGIIIEHQFLKQDFRTILTKTKSQKMNLSKSEYEVLGFDHAEVGEMLAEHWAFPEEFVVAIGHHHKPDSVEKDFSKLASTLFVADHLCQDRGIGYCDTPVRDRNLFKKVLRKLDLKTYALDLIVRDMEREIVKMEAQGLFQYEAA
jgi:HD-like signal output (HDOD) protein